MKKLSYLFCFLCLFNCTKKDVFFTEETTETSEIEFVKTLGGSNNDVFQSVVKASDNGYAILGYTQSNDFDLAEKTNDSFDFWVIKYSLNNNFEWSKTFGGSDDDRGVDIIATSDNGFALLGFSKSNDGDVTTNAGAQDFWIIKITSDGSISWQKSFGFNGADSGSSLIQTSDNGYLITGVLDVTASNGQGNSSKNRQKHAGGDVWAIKLDSSGNLEWSKYYGGSFTDVPFGVVESSDNGFIIAASSDSNDVDITDNKGSYDFWILKIANDGQLIWQKSFGGSEVDEPRGIANSNDGNFVIVGDTRSLDKDVTSNNGGADVWIIKVSNNGDLIWEKTIGGSSFDVARSISNTNDNGFLISGNSRSLDNNFNNKGQNDALILKLDNNGNFIWQKIIGGTENEFLFDAIQLNDNSIIAIGESNSSNGDISENKGFSDGLIIKLK
jgi:hypothetical protein